MKYLWAIPAILVGFQMSAVADTVLPGTEIPVRVDQPITVSHWERGRIYNGHIARDVRARDGDLAIPRGAYAELIVREVGPREYTLDLESVTVNGQRYVLDNAGPSFHMARRDYDDGDGLVSTIVGAIAGATGNQVEARGQEIRVPDGSVIRFNLQQPLHVAGWGDPGYDNGGHHYHRDHDWYR